MDAFDLIPFRNESSSTFIATMAWHEINNIPITLTNGATMTPEGWARWIYPKGKDNEQASTERL